MSRTESAGSPRTIVQEQLSFSSHKMIRYPALVVLFLAGLPAHATIITAPIHISGSGTYSWFLGGFELSFMASGTNGMDSVSIKVDDGFDMFGSSTPPSALTNSGPNSPYHAFDGSLIPDSPDGPATIDGITARRPVEFCYPDPFCFGSYFIGGENGSIVIEQDLFPYSPVAIANVIGYLDYTNVSETFDNLQRLVAVTANFDIVPTPEPSTTAIGILSVAAVICGRRKGGTETEKGKRKREQTETEKGGQRKEKGGQTHFLRDGPKQASEPSGIIDLASPH